MKHFGLYLNGAEKKLIDLETGEILTEKPDMVNFILDLYGSDPGFEYTIQLI